MRNRIFSRSQQSYYVHLWWILTLVKERRRSASERRCRTLSRECRGGRASSCCGIVCCDDPKNPTPEVIGPASPVGLAGSTVAIASSSSCSREPSSKDTVTPPARWRFLGYLCPTTLLLLLRWLLEFVSCMKSPFMPTVDCRSIWRAPPTNLASFTTKQQRPGGDVQFGKTATRLVLEYLLRKRIRGRNVRELGYDVGVLQPLATLLSSFCYHMLASLVGWLSTGPRRVEPI